MVVRARPLEPASGKLRNRFTSPLQIGCPLAGQHACVDQVHPLGYPVRPAVPQHRDIPNVDELAVFDYQKLCFCDNASSSGIVVDGEKPTRVSMWVFRTAMQGVMAPARARREPLAVTFTKWVGCEPHPRKTTSENPRL